jgi:hypothetical protein
MNGLASGLPRLGGSASQALRDRESPARVSESGRTAPETTKGSCVEKNNQKPIDGGPETLFTSTNTWESARPRILIVACSDGRYQRSLDEFLENHLDITYYDRLYAPGGPGVLAPSIHSYFRGEQFRQEAAFLVEVHALEAVIFVFHGPVIQDGPRDATCADYHRKTHGASTAEIYQQQAEDLQEAVRAVVEVNKNIHVSAFRAEVRADMRVQFVPLNIG